MTEDEAVALFRDLELFDGFSGEQLKLLAFVSEARTVAAGEALYEAGDAADGAYVLVSGVLEARDAALGDDGRYTIAPPALVGAPGLILSRPRTATLAASAEARVLFVPREPFLKLLRSDPALARRVADIVRAELSLYLDSVTGLASRFN